MGAPDQKNSSILVRALAVVSALGLTALAALVGSTTAFPLTRVRLDREAGAKLFVERCQSCHSVNGAQATKMGPSLAEIGRDAATRKPGFTAAQYLLESVVEPEAYRDPKATGEMPGKVADGLSDQQILNLVTYLSGLGAEPEYGELVRLKVPPRTSKGADLAIANLDEAERGRQLFLGKAQCSTCHGLVKNPGYDLLAPGLLDIGRHTREYLTQSIVKASANLVQGYAAVTVHPKDSDPVTGRMLSQDATGLTLIMKSPTGTIEVRRYAVPELEPFPETGLLHEVSPVSAMPEFDKALTADDVKDLVSFLQQLR